MNTKKLEILEELFDVEPNTLSPETSLDTLEEWDSVTKLSLIVMIDEEYNKILKNDDIMTLKTINDILNYMEPA